MSLKKSVGTLGFAATVGLAILSVGVHAQDSLTSSGSQQTSPSRTGDMAARVKQAMHSDPALYDKHIDVSMEKGKVVLTGFVTSTDDLHKAIRVANETAGEKNVVNKLTIKQGGDGGTG
jgi:osmotically-inducible protein OsmY